MANTSIAYTSLAFALAALGKDSSGGGGEPGGTISLSIGDVVTGEPGTEASVVNVGTSTEQIWNITIPRGDTGRDGQNGADGKDGSKWYASTGSAGSQVSGAIAGGFIIYNGAEIYQVAEDGTYVNTGVNIRGSQWIYQNIPPTNRLPSTVKSGDMMLYNTMDLYRVTSGVQVYVGNIRGEQGEAGFSPEIEVKTDTEDEYVLTITTQTGSFDTPNLKGSGTGTGTTPYAYAQNLGYSGTQEQFNVAYMNAIGLTERSTGYVVLDGGGANVDTWILDGGDADDFIN